MLSRLLQNKIENLILLHGGLSQKERKDALKVLEDSPSGKAILATGAYIGEGFDQPQLDTLFITMPVSFKGKVVQYAGRLHRNLKSKSEVRIYDYVDKIPVCLKMYRNRLKTYRSLGYEIEEG